MTIITAVLILNFFSGSVVRATVCKCFLDTATLYITASDRSVGGNWVVL